MSPSQILILLLGVAVLSVFSALIYGLQNFLNVKHGQRLFFLKINLFSTWLLPLVSIGLLYSKSGQIVGRLLPAAEGFNHALAASNARVLSFQAENSHLSGFILGVYLLVFSFKMVRFALNYLKMRSLLLNSSKTQIKARWVRTSDFLSSPFSFGFLKPQIFIPATFLAKKYESALDVILTHEETHIRNRDPQWKLISLIGTKLLFFAPTALFLHCKMELEMEIECDRATMKKLNINMVEYGHVLIDAVAVTQNVKPNPMFAYMSDTHLSRRILAMKAKTFNRPVLSGIFGAFILAVGLTAVAGVTGFVKLKGQFLVKAEVLMNGQVVSKPQFIVIPDEPASMEMKSEHPQSTLRMMMTVTDSKNPQSPEGIDLKMSVEYKTQDKSFRANPRVIALPGEESTVTIGSDSGDALELRIKAVRQ